MDEHGLSWMIMDSWIVMDGHGTNGWKCKNMEGQGWSWIIHGWTRKVMESQMNDIAWHERAYIVMERLEMAWKSV